VALIAWDKDDDPDGNVPHIGEHDLTKEEVEWVLRGTDCVEDRVGRADGP
jgi:hypothetical protein